MKFNYILQFRFWPTLLALIMLVILILLGVWQTKRYHYKQNLLSQYQAALRQSPTDFSKLNENDNNNFKPVYLTGHYLNEKTLLLENRYQQGRPGVEVLTPFQINHQSRVLLINRGFTSQTDIPPILGEKTLQGYIQILGYQGFTLGQDILSPNQWPLRIQKINFEALSQLTQLSFYPFILRLTPHQPTTVMPQRHLGYAIQWFAMAFALIVAFLFFSAKRRS